MFSNEQMARKSKKEVDSSTEQIREKRTEIKYDTRDYVVEHIVKKFSDDEFYIDPEYQRNFVWNEKDKCFFIESLLMGLPIPLMFFADTDDGRIEIVDGAQRTQTLVQFVENGLELTNLRVLTESNGFRFQDLELPVQRRFLNSRIRVVFLEEGTTVDTRQEIFRRINTGGLGIVPSEIRRGALDGPFSEFLTKCTKNDLFNKLAPRTEKTEKRFKATTHNTTLLEGLSPESVYIITLEPDGSKEIVSVVDYDKRTQKNNNIRRRYLQGDYDGVPYSGEFDFLEVVQDAEVALKKAQCAGVSP